jgi:hypothetical protein
MGPFKFNLHHYMAAAAGGVGQGPGQAAAAAAGAAGGGGGGGGGLFVCWRNGVRCDGDASASEAGLYNKLNSIDPAFESAWFLNP